MNYKLTITNSKDTAPIVIKQDIHVETVRNKNHQLSLSKNSKETD